jgi:hypothetical protein
VSGQIARAGLRVALLVGAAGAVLGSCYEVPEPDCGFICGPSSSCPGHYTCADDHYCHRIGAPASLVCASPDAALVTDAAADAASDAIDATPDAMPDAPDLR